MGCCPCLGGGRKEKKDGSSSSGGSNNGENGHKKHENATESPVPASNGNIQGQNFTFRELASATKNFTPDCLLGEGGFGRVYKGCLEKSGQIVAVKQLDRNSLQGNKEFLVEVLMLSLLHHPNLVNLVGYCVDGDQRLLVYEFMSNGSLQGHLLELKPNQKPLSWYTRMRIAFGAAQGLEYLHDKANPPVIYRDLKSSNILLDELLNPKLSDFGLAKLGLKGDKSVVSSSIMGTCGYCAPEYARSGELTMKLDVYSFGVVLLELITGRRAIDTTKPTDEQNLVSWAQPMFRDQKRYPELTDPILQGDFPLKGLNQAVAIVAMCLQEEPSVRPIMADVVMTLSFLIDAPPAPQPIPSPDQTPQSFIHSNSVHSESSDEHAVETLQLGLRSHESKPGNHSNSNSSSRSSSSKHSKSSSSSSEGRKEEYQDGSLSSKNSQGSHKYGSRRFPSSKYSERSSDDGSHSSDADHESDGLISRRSDHEYESD